LDQWRALGQIRELGGQALFCIDTGEQERPAILFIHGFPTASWDWHKIWPQLHQHYRLLAWDMLGFGFSAKPNPHQYSIHEQADLAEVFLADAGIQQCHVLAHDYGDTVAQELLARQNENPGWQCLSMMFLNGGLFPETHRALLTQRLLLSPLGPLLNALAGRRQFDRAMTRVFGPHSPPSTDELDNFWALIQHNNGKHLFHNLITYMRDRKQHRSRWVQALQQSAIPLALINGSADPVSGAHMVARYKELGCRLDWLSELPSVGHYPQVEDPQAVSAAALDALEAAVNSS
jgi:pimeloyl-ACP methyl ester carboxylesterase